MAEHNRMAEKAAEPERSIPGVQGPLGPEGTGGDEPGEEAPGTWGGEGGAGAYRGSPVASANTDEGKGRRER